MTTSSSWRLSIGQPCSSKSTATCAEIGVEVSSVEMYSGDAYTAATNSPTSAKLRRACTPPAVAHAPIVTSAFDARRTSWIRSASWAVVIEPSTSDRSYGPSTTPLVASRNSASWTAPATASSSSSRSRSDSWQPSHDANFQTASFGCVTARAPPATARSPPASRRGRRGRSGSARVGNARRGRRHSACRARGRA